MYDEEKWQLKISRKRKDLVISSGYLEVITQIPVELRC